MAENVLYEEYLVLKNRRQVSLVYWYCIAITQAEENQSQIFSFGLKVASSLKEEP